MNRMNFQASRGCLPPEHMPRELAMMTVAGSTILGGGAKPNRKPFCFNRDFFVEFSVRQESRVRGDLGAVEPAGRQVRASVLRQTPREERPCWLHPLHLCLLPSVASRKPFIHAAKRGLIVHELWFSSGKSGPMLSARSAALRSRHYPGYGSS